MGKGGYTERNRGTRDGGGWVDRQSDKHVTQSGRRSERGRTTRERQKGDTDYTEVEGRASDRDGRHLEKIQIGREREREIKLWWGRQKETDGG